MPYDRPHILAQWGGTLPGGEVWSNSVRLVTDQKGDAVQMPPLSTIKAWLDGPAKDAVAKFHAEPGTGIHAAAKLTFMKLNPIGQDGHYLEPTTLEYAFAPPVNGGSSAVLHPNQCTLVVSTRTALERGHAHAGRFYLPLCAKSLETQSGAISPGEAMLVATAAATFLSELHDQPGPDLLGPEDFHVAVMSSVGQGFTNRITHVRVGCVIDTQRRRRNDLSENYQSAPLP